jgi:uncharacterized protein (UPF0261 family)
MMPHAPFFIRLSKDEMMMVADSVARKLNKALGPVKVLIPLGGWSSLDRRGTDFYNAELDKAFVDELKKQLKPDIEVREVDIDLDTPEFAQAIVDAFNDPKLDIGCCKNEKPLLGYRFR